MSQPEQNGWGQYAKLVLNELETLQKDVTSIEIKIDNLKGQLHKEIQKIMIEIAVLRVKSGVWGLMGGLIPALIFYFTEKH